MSFRAEVFHFFGEVEAVFGIWVLPLLAAITLFEGWPAARDYLGHGLNFTEPMFRGGHHDHCREPSHSVAGGEVHGGGCPAWTQHARRVVLSILTLGPILGSFITEPAAMTISALLLARKFYDCQPSRTPLLCHLGVASL